MRRTGSFFGKVSIQYYFGLGDATPNLDYILWSKVLTWENGEGNPKMIVLQTIDDSIPEGLEHLWVSTRVVSGDGKLIYPSIVYPGSKTPTAVIVVEI